MRRLHHKVNIIPVIGKSDACTREELAVFKRRILAQLAEHQIQVCIPTTEHLYYLLFQVYSFPGDSDTDTGQPVGPFAVVGSNVIVQDENGEDRGTVRASEDLEKRHYNTGVQARRCGAGATPGAPSTLRTRITATSSHCAASCWLTTSRCNTAHI